MNKHLCFGFFLALISLCSVSAYGQDLKWINFSVDEGLPSNEVYDVAQDHKGYLWFATDRGVARYDGYNFQVFTTQDGLHNNVIFNIYCDHEGRVWFTGFGGLISYYHYKDESFHQMHFALQDRFKVPRDLGILSVEADTLNIESMGREFQVRMREDSLYFEKGVQRYNPDHYIRIRQGAKPQRYDFEEDRYREGTVLQLGFEDGVDQIPFFSSPSKQKLGFLPLDSGAGFIVVSNLVLSLSDGIFTKVDSLGAIYSSFQESEGCWIGTSNGLYRWRKGKLALASELMKGKSITKILKDRNAGMWFTTRQNGVYYLKSKAISHLTAKNGLYINSVKGIEPINDRNVLITYHDVGMFTLMNLEGKMRHISLPKKFEVQHVVLLDQQRYFIIQSSGVVSLFHGEKLVDDITLDHSPVFYNPLNQKFWRLQKTASLAFEKGKLQALENPLNSKYLYPNENMILFRDTMFTAGVYGLGYSLDEGHWVASDIGAQVRVNDMDQYHNQWMVLATMGKGLAFRTDTGICYLGKDEGLVNDLLNNVYVDDYGEVWAGSNLGLSRVVCEGGHCKVETFDQTHGLLSNQVNGVFRKSKDELWVATSKGISIIQLNQMEKRKETPVMITHLQGKALSSFQEEDLSFPYHESVWIDFLGVNFSREGKVVYEYQVMGLDEEWVETKSRQVRLPKLNNGKYVFQVREKGSQNAVLIAGLRFSVDAPYFKTWWFWFSMISSVVLFVYFRVRAIKRTSQLEVRLAEVRQESLAAQMNPHFIFNAFNSIRSFIVLGQTDKAETHLVNMSDLVRTVLNNSFRQEVSLEEELDLVKKYVHLEQTRLLKGIDFKIELEAGLDPKKHVVPPSVLQPYVENAIIHGLRPLEEEQGELLIRCRRVLDGGVEIRIEDNGIGFDPEVLKNKKNRGSGISQKRLELLKLLKRQRVEVEIVSSTNNPRGTSVRILFLPIDPERK